MNCPRGYCPPDKGRNYEPYLESRSITHVITDHICTHGAN